MYVVDCIRSGCSFFLFRYHQLLLSKPLMFCTSMRSLLMPALSHMVKKFFEISSMLIFSFCLLLYSCRVMPRYTSSGTTSISALPVTSIFLTCDGMVIVCCALHHDAAVTHRIKKIFFIADFFGITKVREEVVRYPLYLITFNVISKMIIKIPSNEPI